MSLLLLGEGSINIHMDTCKYKGEKDKEGKACGYGVATNIRNSDLKYEGTFFKNQIHGIGKHFPIHQTLILGVHTNS